MANNMLPIRKLTDTNGVKYYPLVAGECVLTTESIVAKADIGGYKKDDVIEKATSVFEIIKKLFEGTPVIVDADLSTTSTNAVENRAIATRIASMDTSINDNLLTNLSLNFNSDEGEKKIELKGKDGVVLSSIDASEFVKDGFLESVTLVGKKLKFVFNTDSGKEAIDINLSALDITVDNELKDDSTNPVQNKVIKAAIDDKVDVEEGKGLSTNDFTDELKTKLDGIDMLTKVDVIEGKTLTTNDFTDELKSKLEDINMSTKVDVEQGKGLSSNDFTNDLKTKLEDIDMTSKVDVVNGKGLSTNDFTNDLKTKLEGIDMSTKVSVEQGKGLSTNDFTNALKTKLEGIDMSSKVDTVVGKGLSTNDFTTELKNKLDGIDMSTKVDTVEGKGLSTNDFTTEEKTIVDKFVNGAADYLIEIVNAMTEEQKTSLKTALSIA